MSLITYRREIDGLRALSVLSVIFFHVGFPLFSGGYIGVDVFFVISGFLITSIIISDLQNNTFSFRNFYERRARRILPALFFIMMVSLVVAWYFLLPQDMKSFSQSLVAVNLFLSNILFWTESGYFDRAGELKPLLHTWSLSVEEQYYILFPLLLVFTWHLGRRLIVIMLFIITISSLLLAHWQSGLNESAAFYLLTTRAWELLIGAIVAMHFTFLKNISCRANLCQAGSIAGLLLILFSIFVFDQNTPFPSFYSLAPTIGAALILICASQENIVGSLLGSKYFVFIGMISYSAYLWHQPILAFSRQSFFFTPDSTTLVILSIAPLLLAFPTWKFIEKPFRNRDAISYRAILVLSLLIISSFIFVGVAGHFTNGFPSRFVKTLSGDLGNEEFFSYMDATYVDCEQPTIAQKALHWKEFKRCKQSKAGQPEVILIGDSHAEHLFNGLAEAIPESNVGYYILGGKPYVSNPNFDHIFNEIIQSPAIQTVIITMAYKLRVQNTLELYLEFAQTIRTLQSRGIYVLLVGDIPHYTTDASACAYSRSELELTRYCQITLDEAEHQKNKYETTLKRLSLEFSISYIDLYPAFCNNRYCKIRSENSVLYRDSNHLNLIGSRIAGAHLAPYISTY